MSGFFEAGHTYLHHGEDGEPSTEGLFTVQFVGRAPAAFESYDETGGVAFGWRQGPGADGTWEALGAYTTPDFAGWREVRTPPPAATPDGCRWCGEPRPHGRQYTPGRGQHTWEQPTSRQRLERMQERRNDRLAPPPAPEVPTDMTGAAVIVCYSRCWACQFGDHYDPPTPHPWWDEDDVAHAAETGQEPPTGNCGCSCGRQQPGTEERR